MVQSTFKHILHHNSQIPSVDSFSDFEISCPSDVGYFGQCVSAAPRGCKIVGAIKKLAVKGTPAALVSIPMLYCIYIAICVICMEVLQSERHNHTGKNTSSVHKENIWA